MRVQPADPRDVPFLPSQGELYWINASIVWSGDRKPSRPVVVIEIPATIQGRIGVVTRTSQLDRKGIAHGAAPDAGLTKPGVFAEFHTVAAILWTPRNVGGPLGLLEEEVLSRIMDRFG